MYQKFNNHEIIKQRLHEMDIDILEPESRSEQLLAQLFQDFSHFVLHQEPRKCLLILQRAVEAGGDGGGDDSVGELQGGNDDYSIYRVSFPTDEYSDDFSSTSTRTSSRSTYANKNAAMLLLKEFNEYNCQMKRNNSSSSSSSQMLTTHKIQQYMLGMCQRRSEIRFFDDGRRRNYTKLGNLMLILQFGGPTSGQVRHIDNMVPNIQICLYMSSNCPSTIVYEMDDGNGEDGEMCDEVISVTNCKSLLECWEAGIWSNTRTPEEGDSTSSINTKEPTHIGIGPTVVVPILVREILETKCRMRLKSKWFTKYFAFWKTLDSHLRCFGKLYQPVSYQLGLDETDPGTTLLAGGNEVHAGPPTTGSRMFAFAIGIPEEELGRDGEEGGGIYEELQDEEEEFGDEGNDGEVQYSPVLLHIDFCCLIFSILDYEYSKVDNDDAVREAKRFLLDILLLLIRDYPMKAYLLQIDNERGGIQTWLESVLNSLDDEKIISNLVQEALDSDFIFYSPDVIRRKSKKKKKRYTKAKK